MVRADVFNRFFGSFYRCGSLRLRSVQAAVFPNKLHLVRRVRVELTGANDQQIYSLPPHPTGLPAHFSRAA